MRNLYLLIITIIALSTQAIAQNHPPVAVSDTVYTYAGYSFQFRPLLNDYDPDGDSIYINWGLSQFEKIDDSTYQGFFEQNLYEGMEYSISYIVFDEHGLPGAGKIVVIDKAPIKKSFLDVNNIKAAIEPFGSHFLDPATESNFFEVPKGQGTHTLLFHTLCFGGMDASDNLHLACEHYRSKFDYEYDYKPGPVSQMVDSNYMNRWNKAWKLSKTDIINHISNYTSPGYQPINEILNWPAHGNTSYGETASLAPFYDVDNNNIYDPMAGDYPLIRGDQALYFVFNDSLYTNNPLGKSYNVGIEVHAMAYGFNKPEDSVLNNTIFLHYDIINRSNINYHDATIGLFSDFDLGYSIDDFIGTDVTQGMVYAYNGDSLDQTDTIVPINYGKGYGLHPPAMGMKIIGGPLLPADGIDNPADDCSYSINGLNFNDNIADNERMGMQSSNPAWNTQPPQDDIYAKFWSWMQGNFLMYGSAGIEQSGAGPICKFVFPGNSDTLCNYGTNGILPENGYNQNGKYWTEETVLNSPFDRRIMAGIGAFDFDAGQSIPLDYCFIFARDYNGTNLSSVELLRQRAASLNTDINSLIMLPMSYMGKPGNYSVGRFSAYPNPANNIIVVKNSSQQATEFRIYNLYGSMVSKGLLLNGENTVPVNNLTPGMYLIRTPGETLKFIKQ